MPAFKPLHERYEIADNGCWLWTGARQRDGYGTFEVNGKCIVAHRYFYEFFNSTRIPPGMHIDHLCKRKRCVNPLHLEVVTPGENVRRSLMKTECKRGHPLTGDNLIIRPTGGRDCRACGRFWSKVKRDKRYAEYYTKYNALLDR